MSFKIKRDLGYEAGEYKVTVRDTRNGQTVGAPQNIVFEGQNEIIDRRAMVFSGEKKKKPEEKKAEEKKSDDSGSGSADKSSDSSEGGDDKADDGDKGNGGHDDPPPVEKKSGGCGCRVPGGSHTGDLSWLVPLAVGAALVRRRVRH